MEMLAPAPMLAPYSLHGYPRTTIPLGLETLYTILRQIYPDQPNPLQVAAVQKYWLGGPDPLDYISMYRNLGNASLNIPEHWHYVSFGLSDLHGDCRVHERNPLPGPSGYGFELTFRLKREAEDVGPPTWPASIMQALAKYVFASGNALYPGDHVSWHCPLDNSESRIQHMLTFEDSQLGVVQTPFGTVTFIQIVGVCTEELEAAQGWNGPGVIELMQRIQGLGGHWLITDMHRGETIFELDPTAREAVDRGVNAAGSDLSGVSAKCSWQEKESMEGELERGFAQISVQDSEEIKETLKKGLLNTQPVLPQIRPTSGCSAASETVPLLPPINPNMSGDVLPTEPLSTRFLERVEITLNLEAGTILPMALKGRLKHGRHFTFKNIAGDTAITLVPEGVSGPWAFVSSEHPYAAYGLWLQVRLTNEDIEIMLTDLEELSDSDAITLPKTFEWCNNKLVVTLMHEEF